MSMLINFIQNELNKRKLTLVDIEFVGNLDGTIDLDVDEFLQLAKSPFYPTRKNTLSSDFVIRTKDGGVMTFITTIDDQVKVVYVPPYVKRVDAKSKLHTLLAHDESEYGLTLMEMNEAAEKRVVIPIPECKTPEYITANKRKEWLAYFRKYVEEYVTGFKYDMYDDEMPCNEVLALAIVLLDGANSLWGWYKHPPTFTYWLDAEGIQIFYSVNHEDGSQSMSSTDFLGMDYIRSIIINPTPYVEELKMVLGYHGVNIQLLEIIDNGVTFKVRYGNNDDRHEMQLTLKLNTEKVNQK